MYCTKWKINDRCQLREALEIFNDFSGDTYKDDLCFEFNTRLISVFYSQDWLFAQHILSMYKKYPRGDITLNYIYNFNSSHYYGDRYGNNQGIDIQDIVNPVIAKMRSRGASDIKVPELLYAGILDNIEKNVLKRRQRWKWKKCEYDGDDGE